MAILRSAPNVTTRTVRSRRWMHVNQLELGMYVSEIDLPWSETRFLFQGFTIDSLETLRELQRVCTNVMVDSEKLANISKNGVGRLCASR